MSLLLNCWLKLYNRTIHFVCLEMFIQKMSVVLQNSEVDFFCSFDDIQTLRTLQEKI